MDVRPAGWKHAARIVFAPLRGIIFFAFGLALCEECRRPICFNPLFQEEFP
jgi:hypothetical protein